MSVRFTTKLGREKVKNDNDFLVNKNDLFMTNDFFNRETLAQNPKNKKMQ